MWHIYLVDYFSGIKICPWNEGITTLRATGMELEGSHTQREFSQEDKDDGMWGLIQVIWK